MVKGFGITESSDTESSISSDPSNLLSIDQIDQKPYLSFSAIAEAIPKRGVESARLSKNDSRMYLTTGTENRSGPVNRG